MQRCGSRSLLAAKPATMQDPDPTPTRGRVGRAAGLRARAVLGEKGWRLSRERDAQSSRFLIPDFCLCFPAVPRTRPKKRRLRERVSHSRDTERPWYPSTEQRVSLLTFLQAIYYSCNHLNLLYSLLRCRDRRVIHLGLPNFPEGSLFPDAASLT